MFGIEKYGDGKNITEAVGPLHFTSCCFYLLFNNQPIKINITPKIKSQWCATYLFVHKNSAAKIT